MPNAEKHVYGMNKNTDLPCLFNDGSFMLIKVDTNCQQSTNNLSDLEKINEKRKTQFLLDKISMTQHGSMLEDHLSVLGLHVA